MADQHKIVVANGLLYWNFIAIDNIIDVTVADRIARANGNAYAENFIREHKGLTLILDAKYMVEKVVK